MKAIVITQYGLPKGLELKEVPKPAPRDDELLIRLHTSSINSWDWEFLNGKPFINRLFYSLLRPRPGKQILGFDVSGTVEAIGKFVIDRAKTITLLLLISLLTSPVHALEDEPGFWSLQIENDLWGSKDDRFYTNGWQFSFSSPKSPPAYLEKISDYIPFYTKGETGYYGYALGQKLFTPANINTSELLVNDRPYAGWLFVESFIGHRYFDRGDREKINGLILTLGIVGPASLGEQTQRAVHRITRSDDPRGWDNQLEDELGLNATFLQKWRYILDFDERLQSEVSLHTGLTLGNVYSYASLGLMLRWGTYLKDDIGPPTISPGFPGLPAFNINRRANWYLFAGLEARAVAHNIFLDGNTNVDSHSVDKEELVGDLQIGVAIHAYDARISFSQMFRSEEFEGQPERTQYGLINFTLFIE